ncbi:hypothetical protein ACS0TY_029605 [Phlomoides rotata]
MVGFCGRNHSDDFELTSTLRRYGTPLNGHQLLDIKSTSPCRRNEEDDSIRADGIGMKRTGSFIEVILEGILDISQLIWYAFNQAEMLSDTPGLISHLTDPLKIKRANR